MNQSPEEKAKSLIADFKQMFEDSQLIFDDCLAHPSCGCKKNDTCLNHTYFFKCQAMKCVDELEEQNGWKNGDPEIGNRFSIHQYLQNVKKAIQNQ